MAGTPTFSVKSSVVAYPNLASVPFLEANSSRIALFIGAKSAGTQGTWGVSPNPNPLGNGCIWFQTFPSLKLLRSEIGDIITYPWYMYQATGFDSISIVEILLDG